MVVLILCSKVLHITFDKKNIGGVTQVILEHEVYRDPNENLEVV